MKKLLSILCIFYCSITTLLSAASVEVVVSPKEAVQGNPVQLKIIAEGEGIGFPQIDTINGVPVESRGMTRQTSIQIINGKETQTHTTTLVLTFAPKSDMTIPVYTVKIDGKEYQTKPIALKVTKSTAPQGLNNEALMLMMKVDKHEIVMGEPVVATVYLSVRSDMRLSNRSQYNRPSFKGFFIKNTGKPKFYMKGNYRIREFRYILMPQKEGHYILDSATARVALLNANRRNIFGHFSNRRWREVQSNTFDIDVKPIPQDTDLVGHFYIENKIDKTETKENKPVNLTVTIEGDGNLEDYEMLNYDIDGVMVYSDDAEVSTRVIGTKLKSTYIKKFTFIGDHDFKIPSQTLTVYDPQSKETKILKIPEYNIKVEARHATTTTVSASKAKEDHPGEIQTNLKLSSADMGEHSAKETMTVEKMPSWWMLLIAFFVGIVTTYLTTKLKWQPKVATFNEKDALKVLYAHMSEDPKAEAMVRKLYAKKNGQKNIVIDKKELKALMKKYIK
ncbi:MAG: BatD family protein [Sulfurovum sp.]|nr:BatD family protein [Sulfurovum sp.]